MQEFKDRVAVVTGAASGIGLGMVKSFLNEGMKVVLSDIQEDRLMQTVQSLKDSGADVIGVPADVAQFEQVQMLKRKTLEAYGAVHVLCNNAGVSYGGGASWEIPIEAWRWVLDVNLMGMIHGIHSFIPVMLEQNTEAHIINTSSIAGLMYNAFSIPYGVSKHGVVALSETLHFEMKNSEAKVKVSVLIPGMVNTDILNSSRRNIPAGVPPEAALDEEGAFFLEAYKKWLEQGLDPETIGSLVLEAIKKERFYVITTNDFDDNIQNRMENILERKTPEPLPPPTGIAEIIAEMLSKL